MKINSFTCFFFLHKQYDGYLKDLKNTLEEIKFYYSQCNRKLVPPVPAEFGSDQSKGEIPEKSNDTAQKGYARDRAADTRVSEHQMFFCVTDCSFRT